MDLKDIKIEDPFWGHMQELVTDVVIPFQEGVLNDRQPGVEKSHAIENFKIAAGLSQGEFYGMVFQDSDVAKWLEGVAYSLIIKPDAALEKRADDIIDIIAAAQQPDGYLNTYFTIKEPEHRWQNLLECHELYCAGHMMEAAVAYYEATGKDKLLKVMEGMAGHIIDRFGPDKLPGIPGHQEVEIGLMKLYRVTGKEKYKDMARFFLEERGRIQTIFMRKSKKEDGSTLVSMEWIRSIQSMHRCISRFTNRTRQLAMQFVLHICILQWQIWQVKTTMRSSIRHASAYGTTLLTRECI